MSVPPPENIRYDSDNKKLRWDSVPEADEYEIVYKLKYATDWSVAYSGGNDTECSFVKEPNTYESAGRTKGKSGGKWSDLGQVYDIVVE